MTERDKARLAGVHPDLIKAIETIFAKMSEAGHPMFVAAGVRTAKEQADLYAIGRTKPGHIVTYKDGLKFKSNHQPHSDNLGHAVDCAFVGEDPFGEKQPWDLYGKAAIQEGLIWGGSWKTLVDRPHVELA